MRLPLFLSRPAAGLLLGLLAGGARPALAQVPSASQVRAQRATAVAATPLQAADNLYPRLDAELRRVATQATNLGQRGRAATPAELQATSPGLRFAAGQAGAAVLVRIMASDVDGLLPTLRGRGFVVSSAYPQLHFVEGLLPVSELAEADALTARGLLGVVAAWAPESNGGAVTSQADYVLEAARARATLPRRINGAGVNVGVLSDSYNFQGGAAAGMASGDLPAVNVLNEGSLTSGGTSDEGRGMCELIYDLAPGVNLAFSTAFGGEGVFAQHIRDLANPAMGNCRVIVDDVRFFAEPMFQDGVIAQAITDVVNNQGAVYFASAGNYASNSYENTSPQFVTQANGARYLNFDVSGATTDITQRVTIANGSSFRPFMQWSDPFYTTNGVQSDLDMFLIAVRNGASADTVYRGTTRNIATSYPMEYVYYTNFTSTTNTTTFDLVIRSRSAQAPSVVKYVNFGSVNAAEWLTNSSTAVGHAAATACMAVAAIPYYNQRVAENFTSRGGALRILFSPTGTPLATPAVRQKPDMASIDGTNTTFFGGADYETDGFPNFFGTSAAAPHAAAVAALLRAAEPSLTPAQVYARLVGSARLIGSTTTDPLTGPGLIDAYTTLYGPVAAATPPLTEDLERLALPASWRVGGTGAARATVSSQAPASGTQSLVLDAYPFITSRSSLNEATLFLQNPPAGNLSLSFRTRKFVAETDEAMPAQFTNTSNTDGVALSVNGGTTWYRVADLTGTNVTTSFQTKTVNLAQFAAANNLTLGANVRLKFQQYGRGGSTAAVASAQAGRAFDDIVVSTVAEPAPVALYAYSPQPAAGCPGLQVQFTDSSLFKPRTYAWTFAGGTPATSTDANPLVTYNTPGHHAVTLTVTNAAGLTATRTDTGAVFVYGRRPTAAIAPAYGSVCQGGSVTFASTGASCGTTTYAWSFPGGSPASSPVANPGAVAYAASGSYVATLTVTNSFGSTTASATVDVDGRSVPYAEGFEGSPTTLPRGWTLVTAGNYPWAVLSNITNRASAPSTVVRAPFYIDPTVGEYLSLYTPALNLSGLASPRLRFDLSYAPYSGTTGGAVTDIDSLIVRVADACTGAILGVPYRQSADGGLPTHVSQPDAFVPTQRSDWRQEIVDLTPYLGRKIVLQFRGRNGYGNNLYLDNVEVGNNLLALTTDADRVGLDAWPNPTPAGTSLTVRLPAFSGAAQVQLVDALGRTVWQQQLTQTGAALERTLALPVAPGLYNLVYTPAGGPAAARRIVVQ